MDKRDILITQGDWNVKVGTDALKDCKNYCSPPCIAVSDERGLRLLNFISYNDMMLANTHGEHKASRRWTLHVLSGTYHQTYYIMVQNRFRSGIHTAKTRAFPDADYGSDHDMTFSEKERSRSCFAPCREVEPVAQEGRLSHRHFCL